MKPPEEGMAKVAYIDTQEVLRKVVAQGGAGQPREGGRSAGKVGRVYQGLRRNES